MGWTEWASRAKAVHGPDESMDLKSQEPSTTRAAVLMSRLLRQPREK
jgi:hypothetical protein